MKTFQEFISEAKKCWPGYKKKGTQKLFGKTYNRCVKEDKKTGEEKRAKLYKKAFGKRSSERSQKTGLMVGKVDK